MFNFYSVLIQVIVVEVTNVFIRLCHIYLGDEKNPFNIGPILDDKLKGKFMKP